MSPGGRSALLEDFFSYLGPGKSPDDVLAEKERQWIYAEEEIRRTPSALDGMPLEEERMARFKGTNFITQVGIMLKLSQITIATASVLLNRYLMRRSLVAKSDYKPLHHYQVAGICLFIATKIEEQCRNIKEVVIACCRVALKNPNMIVDEQTKDYWRWRDTINLNEDKVLDMLCFDVNIESPYRILFDMLKYYNVAHDKQLRNCAWSFINDSNLTQACLLFTARTIAAAALYCGAKHCGVDFADDARGRPWWEVQRVKLKDVRRACNYMADGYDGKIAEAAKQLDPQSKDRWSLYGAMRSPDDGDEATAKTRVRRGSGNATPASAISFGGADASQETKRSESQLPSERAGPANGDVQMGVRTDDATVPNEAKKPDIRAFGPRIPAAATTGSRVPAAARHHLHPAANNDDERPAKRARTEERDPTPASALSNGHRSPAGANGRNAAPATTTTTAADEDPAIGSEEGEVEE